MKQIKDYDSYNQFDEPKDVDTYGTDAEYEEELLEDESTDEEFDESENSDETLSELIKKEAQESDWSMYRLDKEYPNEEFQLEKANELYNFTDDDQNPIKEMQEEAIRYATYFARNGNNDAKNFIIGIMQSRDSDFNLVGEMAATSFCLFFRNYIRVEATKYYKRQPISDKERSQRIADAIQQAFVVIFSSIDKYDSTIARINTFFGSKQLIGAFFENEAQRKGYKSKQSMRINQLIIKEAQQLEAAGIEPSYALIAQLTGRSVSQVRIALNRAKIESSTSTLDTPENMNSGGTIAQGVYETPEQKILAEERTKELLKNLEVLSDEEQTVLFMREGIKFNGSELEYILEEPEDGDDTSPLKIKTRDYIDIEKETGINKDVAKQLYFSALGKLQDAYNVGNNKKDRLFSGRGLIFETGEKDDDMLDDIVSIK